MLAENKQTHENKLPLYIISLIRPYIYKGAKLISKMLPDGSPI